MGVRLWGGGGWGLKAVSLTRSLKKLYSLSYWPFICNRSNRKAKRSSTLSVLFSLLFSKESIGFACSSLPDRIANVRARKRETSKGLSFRSLQNNSTDSKRFEPLVS